MKELKIEELEQRIAPDIVLGTNPVPEGSTPQPSGGGNPSHNPVPAGNTPQPSGHK
jgi:hypothetical protein